MRRVREGKRRGGEGISREEEEGEGGREGEEERKRDKMKD